MSAWGLATAALLLCYRVASLRLARADTQTQGKHARTHAQNVFLFLFVRKKGGI